MGKDFDLLAHTAGLVQTSMTKISAEGGHWDMTPEYPVEELQARQRERQQAAERQQYEQFQAMLREHPGWAPQAPAPAAAPAAQAAPAAAPAPQRQAPAGEFGWEPPAREGGRTEGRGERARGGGSSGIPEHLSDMFKGDKSQAVEYLRNIAQGGDYDPQEAAKVLQFMWRHSGEQVGGSEREAIGLRSGGGNADTEVVGNLAVSILENHPEMALDQGFSSFLTGSVIPRFGTGEYEQGREGHAWGYTVQKTLDNARVTAETEGLAPPGSEEAEAQQYAPADLGKWDLSDRNTYVEMMADPKKAASYFAAVARGDAVFQRGASGLIDKMYGSKENKENNTYVPVVAAAMYRAMQENPALMADEDMQRQYDRTRTAIDAVEDQGYKGKDGQEAIDAAMSAINGFFGGDLQVQDRAAWREYGNAATDYAVSAYGSGADVWAENGAPAPVEGGGSAVNVTPTEHEPAATAAEGETAIPGGGTGAAPATPAPAAGPPIPEVSGPETSTRGAVERATRQRAGREGVSDEEVRMLGAVQGKPGPAGPIRNLTPGPGAVPVPPGQAPPVAPPTQPTPEGGAAPGAISQQQVEQSQAGVSAAGSMGLQQPPAVAPTPAVPAPVPPPPSPIATGAPPAAPAPAPGAPPPGTAAVQPIRPLQTMTDVGTFEPGGMRRANALRENGLMAGLLAAVAGSSMEKDAARDLAVGSFAMMAKDLEEWATSDPEGVDRMAKQAAMGDSPEMTKVAEAELIGRLMANGQFAQMLKMADASPVVLTPPRPAGKPFDARHDDVTQEGTPESAGMNRGSNRQAGTP